MKNLLLFIVLAIVFAFCQAHTKRRNTSKQNKDILIGYLDFKLSDSISKKYTKKSNSTNIKMSGCDKWTLEEKDFAGIMQNMKESSYTVMYLNCEILPCYYKTKITNDSVTYTMSVYLGGFITISSEREQLFFLTEEENDLFISVCDEQEQKE
ncbi:hypothetical protein WAF17_19910 [Bernardetia sp. ABR2-2B]|uniref:hypothetical protein n=1 Tax=Bernardetia sp. ABR2-2B TaxID=3127472 RepID=UPI0030CCB1B1